MLGLFKALSTTLSAVLRKPVTVQYPAVHKELPHRTRGFPVLLWDFEVDEPFCTGCHACERACPVNIPLRQLNKKMEKEAKVLFGYEAGFDPDKPALISCFRDEDPQDFIR